MSDGPAEGRERLVATLTARLEADTRFRGLWFTGSLARGDADAYSDADLLAVVAEDDHRAVLEDWPRIVADVTEVVHTQRLGGGTTVVINHVTPDWIRFDVTITVPSGLDRRPRNLVRRIVDRDGLGARLAADRQPLAPDPEAVARLTREFLRVLGLAPVALGRDDLLVAVSGCTLLRQLLIDLMLQDVAVPDRGGALHLSRLLPPHRRDRLAALTPLEATRASVLALHAELAALFLPIARELGERLGLVWPAEFERATRRRLEPLGVRIDEQG